MCISHFITPAVWIKQFQKSSLWYLASSHVYVGTKEKELYSTCIPPGINKNCYCQINFSKFSHPLFCDDRNRSRFNIFYFNPYFKHGMFKTVQAVVGSECDILSSESYGTVLQALWIVIFVATNCLVPIPLAIRSKAWVCGRWFAGIVGWSPAEGIVSCGCCVLSGRGLCFGLINRPEESH